jgi:hypothetical protein
MAGRRSPRPRSHSAFILLILLAACRTEQRSPPHADSTLESGRADSLVATDHNGLEVWFTLARVGRAQDGGSCVERGLEIRRGSTRIPVPLLYTGAVPVLLDQTTMRAELWNHCRPVATYLVDLRSGRPVRERSGT